MQTGTPSDLPTATLSYAAADTQWTLPTSVRTGLLVGVWLTLTATLLQFAWQMWQLLGVLPIADFFGEFLQDPAGYGQVFLLLLLPVAWIVSASAIVARGYAVPLTVLTGWLCLAIGSLHAALSGYAHWIHWQALVAEDQTLSYVIASLAYVFHYLPFGAVGLLLLFARPRFRVAERATQHFQRIAGGAALVTLVLSAGVDVSYFDGHVDEIDSLAKPWRLLMQLLWLTLTAVTIWLAVLIPMGLFLNRPIWTRAAQLLGVAIGISLVRVILNSFDIFQLSSASMARPFSMSLTVVIDQLPLTLQDLTLAFALFAAGKLGAPISHTASTPPSPHASELAASDTPSGTESTS